VDKFLFGTVSRAYRHWPVFDFFIGAGRNPVSFSLPEEKTTVRFEKLVLAHGCNAWSFLRQSLCQLPLGNVLPWCRDICRHSGFYRDGLLEVRTIDSQSLYDPGVGNTDIACFND
jgi:hypothetical protein